MKISYPSGLQKHFQVGCGNVCYKMGVRSRISNKDASETPFILFRANYRGSPRFH